MIKLSWANLILNFMIVIWTGISHALYLLKKYVWWQINMIILNLQIKLHFIKHNTSFLWSSRLWKEIQGNQFEKWSVLMFQSSKFRTLWSEIQSFAMANITFSQDWSLHWDVNKFWLLSFVTKWDSRKGKLLLFTRHTKQITFREKESFFSLLDTKQITFYKMWSYIFLHVSSLKQIKVVLICLHLIFMFQSSMFFLFQINGRIEMKVILHHN